MNDKVAVITGTSSGLGLEMTRSLLERGFLVFGGSRSETPIDHENFIDIKLDIRKESSVIEFYQEIAKETEVIDILINNAGICEMGPFGETNTEEFINHFSTNTLGSFYLLKYFEPFILSEDSQVINVQSISAKYAYPNTASYTMSEQGKRGLLNVIEKEFKKYKVRFQNLYVGAVDTELWEDYEGIETQNMISKDEFMYVFDAVVDAPLNLQFPDITFIHKSGFLD